MFRRVSGSSRPFARTILFGGVALVGVAMVMLKLGSTEGSYSYFRSNVAWLVYTEDRYAYLQPKERELWVAEDGSGLLRETYGRPDFFGDEARSESEPDYRLPPPLRLDLAIGSINPPFDFPNSPESFDALVLTKTKDGTPRALAVLQVARSLLSERIAPSSVRSLLIAKLVDEPGIHRSCAGGYLTFVSEGGSPRVGLRLTLDTTGTLQSDEIILLGDSPAIDARPPIQIGRATYFASGTVESLDSRVSPSAAPGPDFSACNVEGVSSEE